MIAGIVSAKMLRVTEAEAEEPTLFDTNTVTFRDVAVVILRRFACT